MPQGLRRRLTYANVVSTLALFLVVAGGAALAAGLAKNSVKSRHIAPGAVKTSDLGRNAATGAKVKESTLGRVPSAAQATNAASAANAANAGLLDGTDSLGFARPAAAVGEFSEAQGLTLDLSGYGTVSILCDDDPANDTGDSVRFAVQSNMGPTAIQTVTVSLAPSESSPAIVEMFAGQAGNGSQTDPNNVGSLIFRLQLPGGKGVAFFAQAEEKFGSPNCEGSIQAFRIG